MKFATVLTLALSLLLVGACGGDYQAPPKSNSKEPAANPAANTPSGPKPGQNYIDDYEAEAKAALAAWSAWGKDKTPENYAKVGAHLFNAMRFKILSERNRNSTANFYKVREVQQLFTDWKKTFQSGEWDKNREYATAKNAYDEIQQQGS